MDKALRRHLNHTHKEKKFAIMRTGFSLQNQDDREGMYERRNRAPLVVTKNSSYRLGRKIREQEKHDTNKRIRRESDIYHFSEIKKL